MFYNISMCNYPYNNHLPTYILKFISILMTHLQSKYALSASNPIFVCRMRASVAKMVSVSIYKLKSAAAPALKNPREMWGGGILT